MWTKVPNHRFRDLANQTDKLEGELVPKEVVNPNMMTVSKDDELG